MNQRKNGLIKAQTANQMRGQPAGQTRKPEVMQPKKQPVAPPVYRPQAKPLVAQRQAAHTPQSPPLAPPVYRPQQLPKVLQTKSSPTHRPQAGQAPRQPVAPPAYRLEAKKIVQPKANSLRKSATINSSVVQRALGVGGGLMAARANLILQWLAGNATEQAIANAPPPGNGALNLDGDVVIGSDADVLAYVAGHANCKYLTAWLWNQGYTWSQTHNNAFIQEIISTVPRPPVVVASAWMVANLQANVGNPGWRPPNHGSLNKEVRTLMNAGYMWDVAAQQLQ